MIEFKSGERTFRAKKLNPEQALGCVKRLGFMLEGLRAAIPAMRELSAEASNADKLEAMLSGVGPVARAFSAMPDADTKFIVSTCLSVCEVQQAGGWARLVTPTGDPMFELELFDHFVIVRHVLQESLRRFFSALLFALTDPAAEE